MQTLKDQQKVVGEAWHHLYQTLRTLGKGDEMLIHLKAVSLPIISNFMQI